MFLVVNGSGVDRTGPFFFSFRSSTSSCVFAQPLVGKFGESILSTLRPPLLPLLSLPYRAHAESGVGRLRLYEWQRHHRRAAAHAVAQQFAVAAFSGLPSRLNFRRTYIHTQKKEHQQSQNANYGATVNYARRGLSKRVKP